MSQPMLRTDPGQSDVSGHMPGPPRVTGGHTAADFLPGSLAEN